MGNANDVHTHKFKYFYARNMRNKLKFATILSNVFRECHLHCEPNATKNAKLKYPVLHIFCPLL